MAARSAHKILRFFWSRHLFSAVFGSLLLVAPVCVSSAQAASDQKSKPDLTEMSLEELMTLKVATVYGASKFEQDVIEAPASVSIVTAEEIKKYGYRTLAEALRSVRGIYITYDRNYSYIGMRGFSRPGDYNSRVLMLVDGHRVNDNIFDTAPIGTEFPVDIDLIDRIEVIRGSSSSLYGANAFFGVVNVITKQAVDLNGTELAGAAGSFATYNGRVSYGKKYLNGVGLLLSGSVMHSNGPDRLYFKEFDTPAHNNGIAENADGDRNYQFFGKGTFKDLTVIGAYSSRTKGIPTASFRTVFDDPGTQTTDSHGFLDLKYVHGFDDETKLTVRAFFDRYYYHGNYMYDSNNPDNTNPQPNPSQLYLNKDLAWGTWLGGEALFTKTLFERHKVSAGTELRYDAQQDQKNYDVDPFQLYLDDKRSAVIWALYLQDEVQLLDSLIFSAGVRYDHYDNFGGTVNPRLALIYKPADKSVVKFLYGEAFRAPNAYELYYDDGVNIKANPSLKPEKIQTYEIIYEQYFLDHYRSSLSGFYYKIHDLITSEPFGAPDSGLTQYQNVDSADAPGVELELEGKWNKGLEGRVSYTFQRAEDAKTGRILTNSPEHLVKFNLIAPLYEKILFAGLEEQYASSRTTFDANRTGENRTGGSYFTNLTLFSRGALPGLELSCSVYNLFDTRYSDPGSFNHVQDKIEQDGRTFRVKLQYRF